MGKRKGMEPTTTGSPRGGAGGGSGSRPPQPNEGSQPTEEESEGDFCFICKDGGDLILCDYRNCHKAYHPACMSKDESFLKSNEEFICDWHRCFNCNGLSYYRCLCCPGRSVCHGCFGKAEFVSVKRFKRQTKGFCTHCLSLTIMIEKNVEVASNGARIDFNDRETYEFLFKEYWKIINKNEGLTLDNLQKAYARLESGLNCNQVLDSDNFSSEGHILGDEFSGCSDDGDDEPIRPSAVNGTSNRGKAILKERKSKKTVYVGWGSKELITFLSSIGKDTTKPLDQLGAADVVREYIREKNLVQKKQVICDDKLWCLFRKSKPKLNKIYGLLESHIAANATSDDESLVNSEDNSDSNMRKKTRTMKAESSTRKRITEINKRRFASLIRANIKLIYLKRTLVMDLLKQPETFESKVTGCFVRVKNDRKDPINYKLKAYWLLGQVTGIKKCSEEYKIKDISTDIVLSISTMWSEVKISMLSDADFEEEECEDLRLLVQKEHFKRHTVAELEEKARSVHEDITNHWIDKELQRLEKEIEIANEKGWRNSLREYIDEKERLCKPSERQRLLEEIPQIIPDTEDNKDSASAVAASDKFFQKITATFRDAVNEADTDGATPGMCFQDQGTAATKANAAGDDAPQAFIQKEGAADTATKSTAGDTPQTCVQKQVTIAIEADASADTPGMHVQEQGAEATAAREVITIEDDDDGSVHDKGGDPVVIDLDDEESVDTHMVQAPPCGHIDPQGAEQGAVGPGQVRDPEYTQQVWYYIDPASFRQGPVSLKQLRDWMAAGWFPGDFRIWRIAEPDILLRDALRPYG